MHQPQSVEMGRIGCSGSRMADCVSDWRACTSPGLNSTACQRFQAAYSAIVDSTGSLWVGTYGVGLYRWDQSVWRTFGDARKTNVDPRCVAQKADGGIVIGAADGVWQSCEDGSIEYSLPSSYSLCVEADDRDIMMGEALAAGGPEDLSGKSPEIGQVRSALRQVADSDLTVLMLGETGTGKSVAAKLLHANCGAITESLVEAELFGHENGALARNIADPEQVKWWRIGPSIDALRCYKTVA